MGLENSPRALLVFLSSINLLLYIDRGVISSNGVNGSRASAQSPGSGIQEDFKISNAVDGFLPGAFMVGLLVFSPIFAESSKHYTAFRLLAIGLGAWALACAACGIAPNFASLVTCRMIVGIGEASFVALAAPLIDDRAPPKSKTSWLATFYLCIPSGYALGYILGGTLATLIGWRGPFFLEALLMLPFCLYCSFARPIDIKGTKKGLHDEAAHDGARAHKTTNFIKDFFKDIGQLCSHRVYVLNLLASTLYTGVIGAFAFVGPKSAKQVFNIPGETADLTFGAVTVLTGIFGTLIGGIALDRMGSGVTKALTICSFCTFLSCVIIVFSFAFASSLGVFLVPFALGELFLFGIQAPQMSVALWSVPPQLRPFALSMGIVVTHLLGDVPSPTALGWFQDRFGNWRLSMAVCTLFLIPSTILSLIARFFSRKDPDYRHGAAVEVEETGEASANLLPGSHG